MTLAITSEPLTAVGQAAETVLITGQSSTPSVPLFGDFLEGRISQLFLIDILYLGIVMPEGSESGRHLNTTADALERYFKRSEQRVTRQQINRDTP
jgi:RpiR family carbohydrate utilization transcriptional regulator